MGKTGGRGTCVGGLFRSLLLPLACHASTRSQRGHAFESTLMAAILLNTGLGYSGSAHEMGPRLRVTIIFLGKREVPWKKSSRGLEKESVVEGHRPRRIISKQMALIGSNCSGNLSWVA